MDPNEVTEPVETGAESTPAPETPADPFSDDALGAIVDGLNKAEDAPEEAAPAEEQTGDEAETQPEQESEDQPEGQESEQAVQPAIEMPRSWSSEMSDKWASLAPDVQQHIADREKDTHRHISQMGQELSRAKPIAETVTRYQEVFDRHGVDFQKGFEALMHAQTVLDQNPVQGLALIAQTYGLSREQLAQAFGAAPQEGQQANPEVQSLRQQVAQMQHVLNDQQRSQLAQQTAAQRQQAEWAEQTIGEWADGKEHFDTVRKTMASLLSSGDATDLDTAYDMACNAHPEIRQELTKAQKAAEAAKAREEQAKAAAEAKRAAKTNVGKKTGKPAKSGSWEDTLVETANEIYSTG